MLARKENTSYIIMHFPCFCNQNGDAQTPISSWVRPVYIPQMLSSSENVSAVARVDDNREIGRV